MVVDINKIIQIIARNVNLSESDNRDYTVVIPVCSNRRFNLSLPDDNEYFEYLYKNNMFHFYSDWDNADEYLSMSSILIKESNGASYVVRFRQENVKNLYLVTFDGYPSNYGTYIYTLGIYDSIYAAQKVIESMQKEHWKEIEEVYEKYGCKLEFKITTINLNETIPIEKVYGGFITNKYLGGYSKE